MPHLGDSHKRDAEAAPEAARTAACRSTGAPVLPHGARHLGALALQGSPSSICQTLPGPALESISIHGRPHPQRPVPFIGIGHFINFLAQGILQLDGLPLAGEISRPPAHDGAREPRVGRLEGRHIRRHDQHGSFRQ